MSNQGMRTKDGGYACVFGCGHIARSRAGRRTHNKTCEKNINRSVNQAMTRHSQNNFKRRLKHMKDRGPRLDVDTFSEIFDDLPDGAFFAVAEEWGIQPEDFIR